MKKTNIFALIITCLIVGTLWIGPFIFNYGAEIIDGRMEISLSQTTVQNMEDIFTNIKNDQSLVPYFLLMFLSFLDIKGKIIIYYSLVAIIGAIGSYFYFYQFSKNQFISSILSICYSCSLPLAVFFSSKYGIFSHLYTLIPLIGYLFYGVLTNKKHFYLYGISLFFVSLIISPYNLSVYIIVLIFGFWCTIILYFHKGEKINISFRLFLYLIVILIIPFIHLFSQIQSFVNLNPTQMMTIQSETYQMTNMQSSYLNTFFLKGIWDFNVIWPINQKAYDFQEIYGNIFFNTLYLLSIVVFILILMISNISKNSLVFRILGGSVVILIPLIVGAKEGIFSDFYIILYENFTPFQIFRQGYKWMPILVLLITTTYAVAYNNLHASKYRILVMLSMVVFTVYNITPFVMGSQMKNGTAFHIPADYYEIKKQIPKNSKILLLPEQYHSSYLWGSPGGPIEIIFSTNLIFAQPQPSYSIKNIKYFNIIDNILMEQFQTIKNNPEYEYILVRKDVDYKINPELIHDPIVFKDILDANNFNKILETENLVLYKNN